MVSGDGSVGKLHGTLWTYERALVHAQYPSALEASTRGGSERAKEALELPRARPTWPPAQRPAPPPLQDKW